MGTLGTRKIHTNCFWRLPEDLIDLKDYVGFFDYFRDICRSLHQGSQNKKVDTLAAQTQEDVMTIIDCLRSCQEAGFKETRRSLRGIFKVRRPNNETDERINASINLALRLWLTMDIREKDLYSRRGTPWNDVSPLSTFIETQFRGPEGGVNKVLGNGMTAIELKRNNGISVNWINNLEDHLSYDISRKSLNVYHLEYVLQAHLQCKVGIIPEQVIKETVLSFHLLFPNHWNQRTPTAKYLKKLKHASFPEVPLDGIEIPQQFQLAHFHYWQDRLAILLSESQLPPTTTALESTLPTLRLLWNDRRNPHQWWTFWFAATILLLTVIFGVITSVATCMQTSYTYQSLQLARAAATGYPTTH
ncbi:hypothetical protein G7Y79_00015g037940 [Physcia stellaris]|nr:hypothetical protein G7Y79_00015g037940 [Physcia stellaris]